MSVVDGGGNILNGTFSAGEVIKVQAELSESVMSAGQINLTLNTGDVVNLSREEGQADSIVTGLYDIEAGRNVAELSVSSVEIDVIKDLFGNTMVSTSIPGAASLTANNDVKIDTIPVFANSSATSLGSDEWVFSFTEAVNNAEGENSVLAAVEAIIDGAGEWSSDDKTLTYTLEEDPVDGTEFALTVSDFAGNESTIAYTYDIL